LTPNPPLVIAFCDWFRTHRGLTEPTLRQYARGATDLLRTLGEDVSKWNAQALRNFLLERASQCGTPTTQALITSLRAFLRFLNFRGEFRDDLALAIPAVAHWRLARLPRCLSAEEVDRLIAACNGTDPGQLRDRAILLMLARLGLRSGDVARLRLTDIDWNSGTLQVIQNRLDLEFLSPYPGGFIPVYFGFACRASASTIRASPFSFLHRPCP